jgi:hypothetical protein
MVNRKRATVSAEKDKWLLPQIERSSSAPNKPNFFRLILLKSRRHTIHRHALAYEDAIVSSILSR